MLQRRKLSLAIATTLMFCAFPLILHSVSFSRKTQAGNVSRYHADLNRDGREDLIFGGAGGLPGSGGFAVELSTGAGTYAPPVTYIVPDGDAVALALGNFVSTNGDVIAMTGSRNLYVFVNNGDGTFRAGPTISDPDHIRSLVAGDFNHDGFMDIAYGTEKNQIHVLFGPMNNGVFAAGPITNVADIGENGLLFIGDFDGDGKADLMASSCGVPSCKAHVYYGDGTGNFPTQLEVGAGMTLGFLRPFDVNGDGRSDLIGFPFTEDNVGNFTLFKYLQVFYGNAARTWSETRIATNRCGPEQEPGDVSVGDFNGDGIPDIAFKEVSNCSNNFQNSFPRYVIVKTGKGGGAFNAEQTIFQATSNDFFNLETVRTANTNKPGMAFAQCGGTNCQSINVNALVNTTAGAFPSCGAPSAFTGIHVCGPLAGSSVSSPVGFHIGAVGQTPMRKVEVWADGHKISEQFRGAFSKYAFMDKSVPLSSGSHKITVFAAGWDNWLEKTSFMINVK